MPIERERPWSPADHDRHVDPKGVGVFIIFVIGLMLMLLAGLAIEPKPAECWHGMRIGTDESCEQHVQHTKLHHIR